MAHLESLVIFDPSERTREALVFGFERQGYKVYATGDAQDALAMAQTRVPQLFVAAAPSLDPDEEQREESDTVGLIGRLRQDPATRELPIVVLGERGAREPALRAGADEFVARPAFIRDVLTLSQLAVAIRQDGDETGVAGMLEDYELYFLTRALSVAERSGVLELERGNRVGEVHFVKGEVVTARCGRMSGMQAFHQLLLWSEAAIHLRLSSPAGERKIHTPIDELLSGGARFAQEFEAVSDRVGGTRAVYRQEPRRAAEARAQIPAEVMVLLKSYDGRRELIDVVEDSPFKALDTIKITWRLADLGVLERVGDGAVASPLTAQLAVRDWLLGSNQEEHIRSTVTEAGRRAAEAYAEQAALDQSAPPPPAHDLLDDTDKIRTHAGRPQPGAPSEIHDAPTVPRESLLEKQDPQARNKPRKRRSTLPGVGDGVASKSASPPPIPPAPPI